MLQKIIVRQLKLKDHSEVKEVDELTQYQYLGKKWKKFSKAKKEKHLVSRKSEFNINVDTRYGFVAVLNDKVIGFSFAYETLPFSGTLYVRHIAIKPKFQGKGVGPLLFKAMIKKAKSERIKKIWSMINTDNPNSIKLHKKVGFTLKVRKEAVLDLV